LCGNSQAAIRRGSQIAALASRMYWDGGKFPRRSTAHGFRLSTSSARADAGENPAGRAALARKVVTRSGYWRSVGQCFHFGPERNVLTIRAWQR